MLRSNLHFSADLNDVTENEATSRIGMSGTKLSGRQVARYAARMLTGVRMWPLLLRLRNATPALLGVRSGGTRGLCPKQKKFQQQYKRAEPIWQKQNYPATNYRVWHGQSSAIPNHQQCNHSAICS